MEAQYRIVFSGEIREGLSPTKVRANVAARLSVSAAQIERIFSGKPVVLKNGVSETAGLAYSQRLNKLGMVVSMEPMPGSEPVAAVVPALATAEVAAPEPVATSTPFPALTPEPEPEPEVVASAPDAEVTPVAHAVTPPERPIRSDASEAWLSNSSFANLARTHLNLARAEALLNGSEYTNSVITVPEERPWPPLEVEPPPAPVEALVEADSTPSAAARAAAAARTPAALSNFMIRPGAGPDNTLTLSGSFMCGECGAAHQVSASFQVQLTTHAVEGHPTEVVSARAALRKA